MARHSFLSLQDFLWLAISTTAGASQYSTVEPFSLFSPSTHPTLTRGHRTRWQQDRRGGGDSREKWQRIIEFFVFVCFECEISSRCQQPSLPPSTVPPRPSTQPSRLSAAHTHTHTHRVSGTAAAHETVRRTQRTWFPRHIMGHDWLVVCLGGHGGCGFLVGHCLLGEH